MGYRTVGEGRSRACEICRSWSRGWAIGRDQVLWRCEECGHLERDLEHCPASHRDLAYGGEATLDRVRLDLTYRLLVRGGVPASVFEIGHGAGHLLRRFLDDGAQVAGVDPDQLGVAVDPEVARRGRLHRGGVEDLVGEELGRHDLVYGIHVVEHVADPAATFATARALLRPGGTLSLITPAGDSSGLRLHGEHWWMLEDPTHVRFFTARSLARAAHDAGLVDVEVRRPVLDSLSVDVASLARCRGRPAPGGVLASRPVLAASVASVPAVVVARLARPALRPTLQLVAHAPA